MTIPFAQEGRRPVAAVGHLPQPQPARCRQADLGDREERAGDDQQALGQTHSWIETDGTCRSPEA